MTTLDFSESALTFELYQMFHFLSLYFELNLNRKLSHKPGSYPAYFALWDEYEKCAPKAQMKIENIVTNKFKYHIC